MTDYYQLFNICQQEYYCVIDELKCQLMLKISAFLFNTSVDSHESSTTFSCCNIITLSRVSGDRT